MANHNLPTTASTYSNFVVELDSRLDDLAIGLDPAYVTATNVPTNSLRFSSAAAKWQRWSGTAWVDAAASNTYAVSISGNAATVTNGVYTNGAYADPAWVTSLAGAKITGNIGGNAGSASILQTARTINGVSFNGSANISVNTVNSVTFNSAGSGAASGVVFNGGSAITVSYNTVGAPSVTGANASGTWGISISGNAATATTAQSAGTATSATSATTATNATNATTAETCTGNAATVTNGVYTVGDQSIAGIKTFSAQLRADGGIRFSNGTTLSTGGGIGQAAATGWATLAGGIIVQWGTASGGKDYWTSVSFPLAFPNSCFNVQCTVNNGQRNGAGDKQDAHYVQSTSKTGFQLMCNYETSGSASVFWLAIGY